MYKVRNVYKDCNIMDLNLMEAAQYKRSNFLMAELLILLVPLMIFLVLLGANYMPEIAFFAECQNVPGGDICHINIK